MNTAIKYIVFLLMLSFEMLTYFDAITPVTTTKILYYVIVGILIFYILFNRKKIFFLKQNCLLEFGLILFVITYILRIIVDLYILNINHNTYTNKETYLITLFYSIWLPYFFVKTNFFSEEKLNRTLNIYALLIIISCIVSLNDIISGGIVGRASANELLDPISFGHLGATLFLISIINLNNQSINILFKLFWLLITIFSLFIVALSSSRGPVLSILFCVILYLLAKKSFKLLSISFLFVTILVIFNQQINDLLLQFNVDFFDRVIYASINSNSNEISNGRFDIFNVGFDEFKTNIITVLFGSSFLIKHGLYEGEYAHNILLEAFMSTGLIMGILFIIINLYSIKIVLNNFKSNSNLIISAIYIQYFIGGLFSRSLINLHLFWISLIFLLLIRIQPDSNYKLKTSEN